MTLRVAQVEPTGRVVRTGRCGSSARGRLQVLFAAKYG